MSLKKLTLAVAVVGAGLYVAKKKCGCGSDEFVTHDTPAPDSSA